MKNDHHGGGGGGISAAALVQKSLAPETKAYSHFLGLQTPTVMCNLIKFISRIAATPAAAR